MRRLGLMVLVFALAAPAVLLAVRAGYETDSGTISFLRYNLISGGEFTVPPEAARQNLSGSGFFLMRLRPDGAVESVTMNMSTGYTILDQHIMRVLQAYRFRPGTRQPIQWLVGFIQPVTVIVKLYLINEKSPAPPPRKK
jgi:TonB family protein